METFLAIICVHQDVWWFAIAVVSAALPKQTLNIMLQFIQSLSPAVQLRVIVRKVWDVLS